MRAFLIVWAGQLVSELGTAMTRFGFAIWVFNDSSSVTSLAMVILAGALPSLLIGPFAGTVVDRLDRRLVMIGADALAALSTLVLAALWLTGNLELWHIIVVAALASVGESFQQPAYLASVTLLVPKEQLSRANGLNNANLALGLVLAPLLAGVLLATAGLGAILVIDVATFLVAVATLAAVRFPRPEASAKSGSGTSFLGDTAAGLRYLLERKGLLLLLLLAAVLNFLLGFTNVLTFPLLLAFTTEAVVGTVTSMVGLAMLGGSLLMSAWGGPKRRVSFMLTVMSLAGLCVALSGLRASAVWFGAWMVGLMLLVPMINTTSQALWQTKVAPSYQGRVFAARRVIARIASPLAFVLAGPLADGVFEPLLAEAGPLAGSVGRLIGTGPGRGIGFMYVVLGLGLVATALAGFAVRPLREVESELPDAIP